MNYDKKVLGPWKKQYVGSKLPRDLRENIGFHGKTVTPNPRDNTIFKAVRNVFKYASSLTQS